MSPTDTIDALVASGYTVRELERVLGLSHGYLSKVRHGAVRPSLHLSALLEVLRVHPAAMDTVRAATGATSPSEPVRRPPRAGKGVAMETLRSLVPALAGAGIRWAVTGDAALKLLCAEVPDRPGVDVLVDPRDRHVLELLRSCGHALAHHPPGLAICRLRSSDPNESLRIHFPDRPPLADALDRAVIRDSLPVVDLTTLTLANLLSHRLGAEESTALGIAGGAPVAELSARLDALAALPTPRSPYVLRTFDVALARRRLGSLG